MEEPEEMEVDEPAFDGRNIVSETATATVTSATTTRRGKRTSDHKANDSSIDITPPVQPRRARKLLKARHRLNTVQRNIVILDTNVLMHDLPALKEIINRRPVFMIDKIVVPYVVIEELDHLKNKKNKNYLAAQNAIRYINQLISSDDHDDDDDEHVDRKSECCLFIEKSESEDIVTNKTNDDKILNICGKYVKDHSGDNTKRIILLSGDINLNNKARVHKILSKTINEFKQIYVRRATRQNPRIFYGNQSSTNGSDTEAKSSDADEQPGTKKRRIVGPKVDATAIAASANEPSLTTADRPSLPPKSVLRNYQQHSSTNMIVDTDVYTVSHSHVQTNVQTQAQTHVQTHEHTADLQKHVKSKLYDFISTTIMKTFPNNWSLIFSNFGPSSSFYDCLLMIKNNWMGVFSDHFKRNQKTLALIKSLIPVSKRRTVADDKHTNDLLKQLSAILDKVLKN